MPRLVIRAEKLGKEYVIGGQVEAGVTFREMVVSNLIAPLKRLRQLKGVAQPDERVWALKDVYFEVEEGEVLGVIGRNGAGKSTLLKILSRITEPTEGRAEIRGRVASLLEVGTGFHSELTGRENIYLNGAILGMARGEIDRKFDAIVAFADVEKFLDTPVKRYSSGMYMRLAFSVAAHLETDVLLVDEVLAVGDLRFQEKCLGAMKKAAATGRTVLFVSHNLNAIRQLCGRVIQFEDGAVMTDGEPEYVIHKYAAKEKEKIESVRFDKGDYQYLQNVEIIDAGGACVPTVPYEESFSVEVSYAGSQSPRSLIVTCAVSDELGNIIFHSWDTDWLGEKRTIAGQLYKERCIVPASLLRPGRYTVVVEARLQDHNRLASREIAEIPLEILDIGFIQGHKRWGVIAPRFHWDIIEGIQGD